MTAVFSPVSFWRHFPEAKNPSASSRRTCPTCGDEWSGRLDMPSSVTIHDTLDTQWSCVRALRTCTRFIYLWACTS